MMYCITETLVHYCNFFMILVVTVKSNVWFVKAQLDVHHCRAVGRSNNELAQETVDHIFYFI